MATKNDDDEKPDPIEDVRKGLGLLFRAAKGAIDKLPKDKVEGVVVSGAREVGRAIENVTSTIERSLRRDKDTDTPREDDESTAKYDAPKAEAKAEETEKKKDDEPPRGPRIDTGS